MKSHIPQVTTFCEFSLKCSRFRVTACQSAIKGMLRNMSLLKTRFPGLLPIVECTPTLIACMAIDRASSTYSFAFLIFWGGSPCNYVLRTLPTVWCILSHIALDCGFFALVQASLMWHFSNSVWNSIPVNSPPGSCMHRWGHGYRANQHWAYFLLTSSDVLWSILTSSTRLVIVPITLSALNLYGLPRTQMVHGPIRSTAHSSNGMDRTSRSGNSP